MKDRKLLEAAAHELCTIIGLLLEAPSTVTPSDETITPRWFIRLTFNGPLTGALSVGIAADEAAVLARLIMGLDDEAPEAAVADTLREVCGQCIAALGERDEFEGLGLASSQLASVAPNGEPAAFKLTAGDRFTGTLLFWDESVVTAAGTLRESGAATGFGIGTLATAPSNLDVILDIELPLSVRFGQTEMTLLELTRLGPGSVIDLARSPDDPVDVLVHGRLVARGDVVVVSGNYGVRITDVVSAADRVRTLAG